MFISYLTYADDAPTRCPYCGATHLSPTHDFAVWLCHKCGQEFIVVYSDPDDEPSDPIEVERR
jgi:ribosomal protein L37AE/L43A